MGLNVLMFIDSLTRLAHAQREIGLARGEPPGQRGYPPSVIPLLASVVERLGQGPDGSITGIITVLVDGDDHDEPIADAARSLLDGHITLSRSLASRGHFPAVDISRSISRLFHDVCDPEHKSAAYAIRELLACHAEMIDLIQIGAYQPGTSPRVDRAIRLMPLVEQFLRQGMTEASPLPETREKLLQLARQWTSGGSDPVKAGGAK
jgi:flagellum-specific ATP synthase